MACGSCKYNDGYTYTSLPPRFKCTITGKFHFGNDDCDVDFEPVKRGKWLKKVISTQEYGMTVLYCCSGCDKTSISRYDYCPNCGAKMEV